MPTWGNYYWPYFLILVALLFGVPEIIALFTNHQNTLSDYSWTMLNVHRATRFSVHAIAWYASLSVWLVFVVVITIHIWWAGP